MRIFLLLLLAADVALADDAGLSRCRAVKESAARLACYDALSVSPATPSAPSQPARPPVQTPDQFGLEKKAAAVLLEAIDSTIPGRFEGWGPNTLIRLANGQVWQIADGSSAAIGAENPKVRVRRGMFGAAYLEFEGTNRSPRVTRRQ